METINYSATAWGEEHRYELGEETIRYWMPVSKLSFVMNLADIRSVHRKKQTHRYLRAGAVGLLLPFIAVGPVYLKEGNLGGLSNGLLLLVVAVFLVGLFAVIRYRKIHTMLLVKTSLGDMLGIYENEDDRTTFSLIESELLATLTQPK